MHTTFISNFAAHVSGSYNYHSWQLTFNYNYHSRQLTFKNHLVGYWGVAKQAIQCLPGVYTEYARDVLITPWAPPSSLSIQSLMYSIVCMCVHMCVCVCVCVFVCVCLWAVFICNHLDKLASSQDISLLVSLCYIPVSIQFLSQMLLLLLPALHSQALKRLLISHHHML